MNGYKEAAQIPPHILKADSQISPDLFVVDLEFESGGVGLDLLKKIKTIKAKPGVMAMSASLSSQNLIDAMKMGAEDVVPKPFDVPEIMKRMKNLAEIGRERRLFQQDPSRSKEQKRERPIFLSYSSHDNATERVAIFLKSNIEARGIGVWYSEEMQAPKDRDAADHAFKGIEEAHFFLPLITPTYTSSAPCLAELISFFSQPPKDRPRVLLPVLHGSPHGVENFEWISPSIGEHRNLTADHFLDDLIALLDWIQKAVGNGH